MKKNVKLLAFVLTVLFTATSPSHAEVAPDNSLSKNEEKEGWVILFDGKSFDGWLTTASNPPPAKALEHGAINPHKAGGEMLVQNQKWADFLLKVDFKITPKCNSGIFVRIGSLTPREGKNVGYNGIEIAIDDTATAGYVDTGAFYALAKPSKNAMKPVGEWNHIEITSKGSVLEVELNNERVNRIDLDKFTEKNRRPDGTTHKFDVAYKDHPRVGYIGLQDHGSDCWFKNIKVKPL